MDKLGKINQTLPIPNKRSDSKIGDFICHIKHSSSFILDKNLNKYKRKIYILLGQLSKLFAKYTPTQKIGFTTFEKSINQALDIQFYAINNAENETERKILSENFYISYFNFAKMSRKLIELVENNKIDNIIFFNILLEKIDYFNNMGTLLPITKLTDLILSVIEYAINKSK